MDEIRIPPGGDPFYAASRHPHEDLETHYSSLERACGCYGGYHYVGHMVEDEHGDEVEVFTAVSCRRCHGEPQ
jgi:hypothetical protein